MTGETNLTTLLRSMQPVLQPGEAVFCTVPTLEPSLLALDLVGLFREAEGWTLILDPVQAHAAQLPYEATFRQITLSIHSSLEAVGFLAAVTHYLAAQGISVNPVSAYYHDHLFVPADCAHRVMNLLQDLSHCS